MSAGNCFVSVTGELGQTLSITQKSTKSVIDTCVLACLFYASEVFSILQLSSGLGSNTVSML